MSIEPFNFQGNQVRVLIAEDGEPRWIASDVAKVLGYRMAPDMTRSLDEDEKGTHIMRTPGGDQQVTVITESGLYSAILRSRKPEAREFKRWVTHEVLPSIRRRGGYLTPEAAEQALTDPDFIIRLATELKQERQARAVLEQQAKADKPKVLFADAVSTSTTTILVGDLAKLLKGNGFEVGQKRLFAWLRENGYLIKRKGADWNMPTQRAMELGLFKVKETAVTHSDGHVTVSKTPKVTGKGQEYFVSRFMDGRFTLTTEQAA
ncbi:phage antirepressor KilAC domain-containing protein [Corynebacterium lizhenjunii]|uniref:Phage antirepressor KilAC domain-containing protein n=1 Tax=Corynebacterium lizhenjunii TaxID=2709394 RepID=A0A7T0KCM1_9CORY|nr:phage antirepressor KilAC domain-containing protein [Corynebacterium lizhenjunii]QPK78308.1 phage antirepressor KilAC domain-containing protein [Corynebacterium lizhenjunii]